MSKGEKIALYVVLGIVVLYLYNSNKNN